MMVGHRHALEVGISVSALGVGYVGVPQCGDCTTIGDSVSLARRLQEHALPVQILLSSAAYEMLSDMIEAVPGSRSGLSPCTGGRVQALHQLVSAQMSDG